MEKNYTASLPLRYIRDELYRRKIEGDLEPVDVTIYQKTEDEKRLLKIPKANEKQKSL